MEELRPVADRLSFESEMLTEKGPVEARQMQEVG